VSCLIVVFNDARKLDNAWVHPEISLCHFHFLSDAHLERIQLSFHPEELKKIFWWESIFDGCQNRIFTGIYDLYNIKFRSLLFKWFPPHPAVSFSWLITLLLIPALLYNFIRKKFQIDVLGHAVIVAYYLLSLTTVGNTFQLFHPSKILISLSFIVLLNCFANIDKAKEGSFKRKWLLLIFSSFVLYVNFFIDPYQYAILFIIPVFFPHLFFDIKPSISLVTIWNLKDKSSVIVYAGAAACFLLTVFVFLPLIFKNAGYHYGFMSTLQDQMKEDSSLKMPLWYLFRWKYYLAVLINFYWFIVSNVGLRQIVPLFAADFQSFVPLDWATMFNPKNALFFSMFHLVFWGSIFLIRSKDPSCKNIIRYVLVLYIITAWVTLVHSHQHFLVPYATYVYGSVFTLFMAIFLGFIFSALRSKKKVYWYVMLLVLIGACANYGEAKKLNARLKTVWLTKPSVADERYKTYAKLWNKLKGGELALNHEAFAIHPAIKQSVLNVGIGQDAAYSFIWQELSGNPQFQFAAHFAAFAVKPQEK